MALEFIVNEDYTASWTLETYVPAVVPPVTDALAAADLVYGGDTDKDTVGVVSLFNSFVKANNKNVMVGASAGNGIISTWVVSVADCPYTSLLYDFVSGVGTVEKNADYVKADGIEVLTKSATGTCRGSWVLKAKPPTVTALCQCNIEISDPGQDKVKAE